MMTHDEFIERYIKPAFEKQRAQFAEAHPKELDEARKAVSKSVEELAKWIMHGE